MKREEIYIFVKTIIENGVENNLQESKIVDGVDKYLNLLNDQNLIDSEYYMIMQIFKGNIKVILENKENVDQVYTICLNTIDTIKSSLEKANKDSKSLVSPNKYKPLSISDFQDLESKVSISGGNCASTLDTKKPYVYDGCFSGRKRF